MSYNGWLYHKLRKAKHLKIESEWKDLIRVEFDGRTYNIYAPEPREYIVTVDIVDKVLKMGGNTISYPHLWCRASLEAISYGEKKEVRIMPHGELFQMLDCEK